MVVHVILKNQVTSYFRKKNVTAITTVITDVWRKEWARTWKALHRRVASRAAMGAEESTFAERRGGGGPGGDDSEPVCATAACRGTGAMGRHERRRNMPGKALARILQDYGIREDLERRSNGRSCPCRHRPGSRNNPTGQFRSGNFVRFRTISGLTKV